MLADLVQPPPGYVAADWDIIQACGIFAISVSGHSSLPVLRNSMARVQVRPQPAATTTCPVVVQASKNIAKLIHKLLNETYGAYLVTLVAC